jgi:spore coat protein U-like protein
MRRQIIAPVVAGVLLALAGTAHADQKSTTFQVSTMVKKNCLISAGNMDFGDWTVENNTSTTSTISVRCTNGTAFDVFLDAGLHSNSDINARQMDGPGDVNVRYNLYTDGDAIWGDGTTGASDGGTGAGMGSPKNLTVTGKLFVSDNEGAIEPGLYSDTVTATVEY